MATRSQSHRRRRRRRSSRSRVVTQPVRFSPAGRRIPAALGRGAGFDRHRDRRGDADRPDLADPVPLDRGGTQRPAGAHRGHAQRPVHGARRADPPRNARRRAVAAHSQGGVPGRSRPLRHDCLAQADAGADRCHGRCLHRRCAESSSATTSTPPRSAWASAPASPACSGRRRTSPIPTKTCVIEPNMQKLQTRQQSVAHDAAAGSSGWLDGRCQLSHRRAAAAVRRSESRPAGHDGADRHAPRPGRRPSSARPPPIPTTTSPARPCTLRCSCGRTAPGSVHRRRTACSASTPSTRFPRPPARGGRRGRRGRGDAAGRQPGRKTCDRWRWPPRWSCWQQWESPCTRCGPSGPSAGCGRAWSGNSVLAANAQAELAEARARLGGRAGQLQALFAGIEEGVLVLDAELRLAEWNQRFPVLFGIAPDALQRGLPLDELLRTQARDGAFGTLDDIEGEVATRLAQLRRWQRDRAVALCRPRADARWRCSPAGTPTAACCWSCAKPPSTTCTVPNSGWRQPSSTRHRLRDLPRRSDCR